MQKRILQLSARTVNNMVIGQGNVLMRRKEITVFYAGKTLMIHFNAMQSYVSNVIRWAIKQVNVKSEI